MEIETLAKKAPRGTIRSGRRGRMPAQQAAAQQQKAEEEAKDLDIRHSSRSGTGYLGVKYAALATGKTPTPGIPFSVRGMTLDGSLTVSDVERRQMLLEDLDQRFHAIEDKNQLVAGLDRFTEQAHKIITSPKAKEAFDTSRENSSFAAPFGETKFGQSCLLATRLVEHGVPFVTISYGGWDTHRDNWNTLKNKQAGSRSLGPFNIE